ncbi:hypothetical protein PAXRUDRAFT_412676 [Paxillus rubicundulus Ve08.2h10]|uniref:Uncharacterized protein n=1 Tax=Paxillus rubicundulus Ve08.2h10 TaxID=930991 RepID=A0A0D0C0B8_9AGAM|nr:hypothetical protein PAXRUDRAFT_412676 [Paxillus rubicundulus Ve08.2h10]
MPHKRKPAGKRQHYSRDLKQRVIYQAQVLGNSSTAIAISLDMPIRVVQRIIKLHRDTGDVATECTRHGRYPLMPAAAVEFMLALLQHSPDLYLDEIQEQLLTLHQVDISLTTIW